MSRLVARRCLWRRNWPTRTRRRQRRGRPFQPEQLGHIFHRLLVGCSGINIAGHVIAVEFGIGDEWSLRDYVAKGIEVLGDGDAGFFMMCEGGGARRVEQAAAGKVVEPARNKLLTDLVNWACHANDCAAAIHDVMALEDCVAEAVAFCEDHPETATVRS